VAKVGAAAEKTAAAATETAAAATKAANSMANDHGKELKEGISSAGMWIGVGIGVGMVGIGAGLAAQALPAVIKALKD
jgi:nucleoside recognition membrane protein YjiH